MKIAHPSFRTTVLAGSLLVLASTTVVVLVAAQTQESCPPIIASILPKNASGHAGQYFPGDMSSGRGSADLSFDNPTCAKQKFSARISIAVTHYGGETAVLRVVEEELRRLPKLRFVAAKPPPSHVFEQVALTAAEESGGYS